MLCVRTDAAASAAAPLARRDGARWRRRRRRAENFARPPCCAPSSRASAAECTVPPPPRSPGHAYSPKVLRGQAVSRGCLPQSGRECAGGWGAAAGATDCGKRCRSSLYACAHADRGRRSSAETARLPQPWPRRSLSPHLAASAKRAGRRAAGAEGGARAAAARGCVPQQHRSSVRAPATAIAAESDSAGCRSSTGAVSAGRPSLRWDRRSTAAVPQHPARQRQRMDSSERC
jgi:hypothetical protein